MNRFQHYLIRRWRKYRESIGSGAARKRSILQNVERFLVSETAGTLGLHSDELALEKFQTGRRTLTLAWDHSEQGPLVVRAWAADEKDCPARHYSTAAGLVSAAEVPVPEVLLTDDSGRTRCNYGIEVVVERRAPGQMMIRRKPVSDKSVVRLIGTQLGRLHSQTGDEWGTPWLDRNPMHSPREFYRNRVRRYGEDIGDGLRTLSRSTFGEILKTTSKQVEEFRFNGPSLSHGDFFAANLIQDGNGSVTWIDFETVHYGLAGIDLVSAQRWLGPLGQFDTFREAYEAERGVTLEDREEERVLSARLSMLHKLASRVRRLRKYSEDNPRRDIFRREQIEYEQCLCNLQEAGNPEVLSAQVRELLA